MFYFFQLYQFLELSKEGSDSLQNRLWSEERMHEKKEGARTEIQEKKKNKKQEKLEARQRIEEHEGPEKNDKLGDQQKRDENQPKSTW